MCYVILIPKIHGVHRFHIENETTAGTKIVHFESVTSRKLPVETGLWVSVTPLWVTVTPIFTGTVRDVTVA